MEKMIQPLVSVIVPVYNTSQYIDKCLESLTNQTLRNIEIICVNDMSTDDSLEKILFWAKKDERVIVIDSKEKVKAGGARNLGIKAAKGMYIGLVDSDDFVSIGMYQMLIEHSNDMSADIVNSNYYIRHGIVDTPYYNIPDCCENLSLCKLNKVIATRGMRMLTGIFKKSLFDDNNLYYPERVYSEDSAICMPLFLVAKKIVFVDNKEPTYYYRTIVDGSITKIVNAEKIRDLQMAGETMLDHTKRLQVYDSYRDEIDFAYYLHFFRNSLIVYLLGMESCRIKDIRKMCRKCNEIVGETKIADNPYYKERKTMIDLFLGIAGNSNLVCFALICYFKVKRIFFKL